MDGLAGFPEMMGILVKEEVFLVTDDLKSLSRMVAHYSVSSQTDEIRMP